MAIISNDSTGEMKDFYTCLVFQEAHAAEGDSFPLEAQGLPCLRATPESERNVLLF